MSYRAIVYFFLVFPVSSFSARAEDPSNFNGKFAGVCAHENGKSYSQVFEISYAADANELQALIKSENGWPDQVVQIKHIGEGRTIEKDRDEYGCSKTVYRSNMRDGVLSQKVIGKGYLLCLGIPTMRSATKTTVQFIGTDELRWETTSRRGANFTCDLSRAPELFRKPSRD